MFNSPIYDVCLGLIFIYLLYSLLASIIQEIVASWLKFRQRMLYSAIERMLEDQAPSLTASFKKYFMTLWKDLKYFFTGIKRKKTLTRSFYEHPSILYLGENRFSHKPSYISAATFAQTLIKILRKDYNGKTISQIDQIKNTLENNLLHINPDTLHHLKDLLIDSGYDIDKFRANLENWFEEMMDRVSGWYKRKTQLVLFIIGFGMAMLFNIDTIVIYKILSTDQEARAQLVTMAINKTPEYGHIINQVNTFKKDSSLTATQDSIVQQTYNIVYSDAKKTENLLGLGWGEKNAYCDSACIAMIDKTVSEVHNGKLKGKDLEIKIKEIQSNIKVRSAHALQYSIWMMMSGWLITALAISLGAPFWFDLLNKITQLRATGKTPDTSTKTQQTNTSIPADKRVG